MIYVIYISCENRCEKEMELELKLRHKDADPRIDEPVEYIMDKMEMQTPCETMHRFIFMLSDIQ